MNRKIVKIFISVIVVLIITLGCSYFQNNAIVITKYNYKSTKVPKHFNNYRIVQLSDLHSKSFGNEQKNLISKVENLNPNIILFTGDLVDSKNFNMETSILLMKRLVKFAPVYFVTGNHEWWSQKYDSLDKKLKNLGVNVLRNESKELSNGSDKILITGIDDPAKQNNLDEDSLNYYIEEAIQKNKNYDGFKILLTHRPGNFNNYSKFDLVFSGHTHGGQFRLPGIGGIVAPEQGFFPEYDSGEFIIGEKTKLIINRGLGNSIIPQRIFNRPEIVVVDCTNSK